MFVKRNIPKIVYSAFAPLIPVSQKIDRLKSLFTEQGSTRKIIDNKLTSVEKGHQEHIQNLVREKEETKEVVDQLIKKSNRLIMSIKAFSFVPFGLFKNIIEVEESRVIFIFKQPFTFQSHSVDIPDISNVFIESALLFAKMQIVSRTFIQNNITIGYLNKRDANKAKIVIEGLRTFSNAKIDTSVYEKDELIKKLEELNTTR